MGIDFKGLNNKQIEAVIKKDGAAMVMAGFGTGKTSVITNRVANLIDQDVKPEKIMVSTFTRKAASELKDRVGNLIGDDSQKLICGTFHSTCLKIIRELEGKDVTVIDDIKARTVLSNLLVHEKADIKTKDLLLDISWAKAWMIKPDKAKILAKTEFEVKMARIYAKYEKFLKENNLVDFDNLIYKVIELYREDKYRNYFKELFDYVLVDEYQDTNRLQNEFLKIMAGNKKNIFVVGDMHQSLYSFMGSNPEGFMTFPLLYPQTSLVVLDINYRSTERIISSSFNVIAHNHRALKSKLKSAMGIPGDEIKLSFLGSDQDESYRISQIVKKLKGTTGILVRANWQIPSLLKGLSDQGIQVKELAESREVDEVIDLNYKIFVMTIHASKGLEFDNVIVVGMEEGLIPYLNGADIEEERRIFYVAITRAKQKVFLLSCECRKNRLTKPSRFLKEIPEKLLNIV
jgi:DNA helicase-2/ATP-dependent DNA helicase PcrA